MHIVSSQDSWFCCFALLAHVKRPPFTKNPYPGIAQANPLSAHIRVPLAWYHSATFAFLPDETASQIRRVYDNPFEGHARRHFCGFCGTPLTYWSEQPRTEADYIQVTMGSLCREDLGDLEDMGLLPEEGHSIELPSRAAAREAAVTGDGDGAGAAPPATSASASASASTSTSTVLQPITHRETTSIPWFDSIMEGSRLGGRLRTTRGTRESADGTTRVEWEIVEYNDDDTEAASTPSSNNGKRKLGDRDDVDDAHMEGVSQS